MYNFDFNTPSWVHFIGIGGISMSGLAELLKAKGFKVTGSDSYDTPMVKKLQSEGIDVAIGQSADNIKEGMNTVVYTAAIHPDNPEYAAAFSRGIPMLNRAEFLGQVMKSFPVSINVSGTHGKTTTTSMVSELLLNADKDPTIFVGGMLDSIGGNYRIGGEENFVAEACEYTNSFLYSYPTTAIILNVCAEHLDFFKGGLAEIRDSFNKFAKLVPESGLVVIDSAIENYEELLDGVKGRVKTVGLNGDENYTATDIEYDDIALPTFTLKEDGKEVCRIKMIIPGEHNVRNALAAIAAARDAGVSYESIASTFASFRGAHRRFEIKGKMGGVTIIDDYAHHPDEIRVTLDAAKKYKDTRVLCVFQPHTFSRVRDHLDSFIEALSHADVIVMADVYNDREADNYGVSSKDISDGLVKMGKEAYYFQTFDEIEKFFLEKCVDGDLLITIGSKNVYLIGDHLLGR